MARSIGQECRYYKIYLVPCCHHCLTYTQAKSTPLIIPQCWFLEAETKILFFSRQWELSPSTDCQICIQTPEIKVILFTCLNKHLLRRKLGFYPYSTSLSFSFTSKKQNFSIIKVVYGNRQLVTDLYPRVEIKTFYIILCRLHVPRMIRYHTRLL